MFYTLTNHARLRMEERALDDELVAAALAGRVVEINDNIYHYDRATRCCIVGAVDGAVVTMFRAKKSWVKRTLSR